MGKRGPKPGFKQERAKAAAADTAQAPNAAAKKRAAASPISDAQQPSAPAGPVATVTQAAPVVSPPPPAAPPKASKAVLSASDRENPNKLSGKPLRELAHRRGLAKSSLPTMSDEKIREQLRYMTHRQYDDAVD
jgi:hypothetical protein